MNQQKGLFSELLRRRIPQILGMYVASLWLCVEIADWMGERFPVPETLSAHVFVFMLILLPSVAILAWGHGKPGKDQWTKFQAVSMILNLVLACWASLYFVDSNISQPVMPPALPEHSNAAKANDLISKKVVVDETTGESISYEVANKGMNQKINLFFFENNSEDESLDWLSGGASWLLSQDLKRSPLISVDTPYDSESMRRGLQNKGFAQATGEPLSLDLQIAQQRFAQWMVKGEVFKENDQVTFKAELYDVMTGALVKTVTHQHTNWLAALDVISQEISAVVLGSQQSVAGLIPDLSIDQHVSANIKAIQWLVKGLHEMKFNNDYAKAKEALLSGVALDKNLAEAYVVQMRLFINMGDYGEAEKAAKKALNLDYKLYGEDVFTVKALLYGISGQEDKALKVIENWVKVYPESAEALFSLGQNLVVKGHRLDDAIEAFRKLSVLEKGSQHLHRLSQIYTLKGELVLAKQALNEMLEYDKQSVDALIELGKVSQIEGNFEKASSYFEEAMLVTNNSLQPAIQYARNIGVGGEPNQAIPLLKDLLDEAKNSSEYLSIYGEMEQMYLLTGELKKALEVLELSESHSTATLPPIAHLLNFQGKKVAYVSALGENAKAKQMLDELEQSTQPPINQTIVFMRLAYHSIINDGEGIKRNLEKAKQVMAAFKMSVYQQFIYNYEAVLKRTEGQFEDAIVWHDKAISEASQSVLALTSRQIIQEFRYQKAKTIFAAKKYHEALDLINELIQKSPRLVEFRFLKAEILFEMGKSEEIKDTIQLIDEYWQRADEAYTEFIKFKQFKQQVQPQ
ncbi:tetratricopeptide repeat protein [Marinicella rhabdoformis]|uniref:tetratricopeptide repeat protein n=1 Tax=Marinicella rhabdoformis TaxID=2580566 RepID=UPI0012AEB1EC|nr:tetratricopeptide repeat protein [Marinicella rhabdoformis]